MLADWCCIRTIIGLKAIRFLSDIPLAMNLLGKQGLFSFLKRIFLYINGIRVPVDGTAPGHQQKKIIFLYQSKDCIQDKGPMNILKILFLVFGYDTAVMVMGHIHIHPLLVKTRVTKSYPGPNKTKNFEKDLKYLKNHSFFHAMILGNQPTEILSSFRNANIPFLLLPGEAAQWDHDVAETRFRCLLQELIQPLNPPVTSVQEPVRKAIEASHNLVKPGQKIAVILHLWYPELWPEIASYLKNIPGPFDLYISLNPAIQSPELKGILDHYPKARLYCFENRGRDILPFLEIFRQIGESDYQYICKIHSKQSPHFRDDSGLNWRVAILDSLLGSPEIVHQIIKRLSKQPSIGIIAPKKFLFRYKDPFWVNYPHLNALCQTLDIPFLSDFRYPAGTMFWFKPDALQLLKKLNFKASDFPMESSPAIASVDGSLVHAMERFIPLCAMARGFRVTSNPLFR